MLSNPPIPHLGREFNDEATEVENYEVRLVLYNKSTFQRLNFTSSKHLSIASKKFGPWFQIRL